MNNYPVIISFVGYNYFNKLSGSIIQSLSDLLRIITSIT